MTTNASVPLPPSCDGETTEEHLIGWAATVIASAGPDKDVPETLWRTGAEGWLDYYHAWLDRRGPRAAPGTAGAVTPGRAGRILPEYGTVGEAELSEAVHQAVGAASVCWERMEGTGVFDDARARQVAAELIGIAGQYADDAGTAQGPSPAPGPVTAVTPGQAVYEARMEATWGTDWELCEPAYRDLSDPGRASWERTAGLIAGRLPACQHGNDDEGNDQ